MLLALATPKLCDLFSLALVSPLPLWREGKPVVGVKEENIPTPSGWYSTICYSCGHSTVPPINHAASYTQLSSTPLPTPGVSLQEVEITG